MKESAIRDDLETLRIDRTRDRSKSSRVWFVVGIAAVLAGALGGVGWWLLGGGSAPPVRVAAAQERAGATGQTTVLNASGYVTARRRATVSSKITGKLVEVDIEEGDVVAAGQVLARLDDSQHRAALRLAESQLEAARREIDGTRARLELAEITLSRTERLVQKEISRQADLDAARSEADALRAQLALDRERVHVAEREVALRETQLADTVILAPYPGVVVSKDAQEGEMVSPVSAGGGFTRTGIGTLVDMDSLEIEVEVNEAFIARVRKEQQVEAVLDAYPDWKIPARVITPVPTADRQKATVLVRIGFVRLDPRILPDMGIKVAFLDETSETRAILTVPQSAIRRDGERSVVLLIHDDRVERRAVTVGETVEGNDVEVLAGLVAGERVIVEGPEGLSDGDRVRVE